MAQNGTNTAISRYLEIERKAFDECRPLRAHLELTHRCNFRCVHCFLCDFARKDELDAAAWFGILEKLKRAGVIYLTFSGGEFLLRSDSEEITRQAKRMGFLLRFFTNASLVDEKVIAFWKTVFPSEVEVSLYGASEETYKAVCGSAKLWAKTRNGIKALAKSGIKTLVKIVALEKNRLELEKMISFAQELGLEYRISGKLTPKEDGDISPLKETISEEHWLEFHNRYEANRYREREGAESAPCAAGRSSLTVAPNGDVYPCVELRKKTGNLAIQEFEDFWHTSPLLLELRNIRNCDFCYPENLDETRAVSVCMGLNYLATGSLTKVVNINAETCDK